MDIWSVNFEMFKAVDAKHMPEASTVSAAQKDQLLKRKGSAKIFFCQSTWERSNTRPGSAPGPCWQMNKLLVTSSVLAPSSDALCYQ